MQEKELDLEKIKVSKKIDLFNVSIICIDDRNIDSAIHSIETSSKHINFGKKILITNESLLNPKKISLIKQLNIEVHLIPKISSINDFSFFCLNNLIDYVKTDFCLLVQWDGWVINPFNWNSSFLEFDYIGAAWPHYKSNNVGNGGFSLRSKKLLEATKEMVNIKKPLLCDLIEDDFICREFRDDFVNHYKIKFPSAKLADKFSIERKFWTNESFGFHGFFNFDQIFTDNSYLGYIENLHNDCYGNRLSYDLVINLLRANRFSFAKYVLERRVITSGWIKKNIRLKIFFLLKRYVYRLPIRRKPSKQTDVY